MRTFIIGTVIAASLLSAGCYVGPRARPVAHYHRGYGPPPPPPARVHYERRYYYGDDRGYRHRHDGYWR